MSSVTQDAAVVIVRMFDRFDHGDIETIRHEIFDPDLVWVLPGRHPLAGAMHGPDEVLAFFKQLTDAGHQVIPTGGVTQLTEDTVVAFFQETSPVHNGQRLDIHNCLYCRIESGKVKNVQVYVGDQYAADNYFNAAFKLTTIPERLA